MKKKIAAFLSVLLFVMLAMPSAALAKKPGGGPRGGFRPTHETTFLGSLTNDGQEVQSERKGKFIHSDISGSLPYTLVFDSTYADEDSDFEGPHDGYLAIIESQGTRTFYFTWHDESSISHQLTGPIDEFSQTKTTFDVNVDAVDFTIIRLPGTGQSQEILWPNVTFTIHGEKP